MNADETHTIFFPKNKWQTEAGVFSTELTGNPAESPPCRSDKIVFFVMSVAVLHDWLNIVSSSSKPQVLDSSMSCGVTGRLSQTA
jgi:hypothetical protein